MALTDSIKHYWKFDASNSNDSVGSKNGTDTSVTYSAGNGKINNGVGYSGSASYTTFGNATMGFANAWSISFWVKPTNFTGNPRVIFIGPDAGADNIVIGISTAGKLFCNTFDSLGNVIKEFLASTAIIAGSFAHFVVTWDGTSLLIYVNGSASSTTGTNNSGTMADSVRSMYFSGTPSNTALYTGALDEVGMWSRAVSSSEVTDLYGSGSGNQYPFAVAAAASNALLLAGD